MLITPEYLEQNKKLHERADFGNSSGKWGKFVAQIANANDFETILDYGCGKGDLKRAMNNSPYVFEYDPCIDGKDGVPEPRDMVVCTDVLEHIEPDCLDDVLDDLKRVTKRLGLFTICTIPAEKTLEDGRNAHLIQEDFDFWLPKLWARFRLMQMNREGGDLVIIVTNKDWDIFQK